MSSWLRRWFWILDGLAVVLFAVLGRADHGFDSDVADYLRVSAPLLIGLVASIVVLRAWRHPLRLLTGLGLAVGTIVIGMGLRNLVWGDGTALSFMLVATGFIVAAMVGWRLLALAVAWLSARRTRPT